MLQTIQESETTIPEEKGGRRNEMLALTILFLSIVVGVRIFFYMPMRAAMGNPRTNVETGGYDQVSMFFLNMMYWGFVLVAGAGFGVAVALL